MQLSCYQCQLEWDSHEVLLSCETGIYLNYITQPHSLILVLYSSFCSMNLLKVINFKTHFSYQVLFFFFFKYQLRTTGTSCLAKLRCLRRALITFQLAKLRSWLALTSIATFINSLLGKLSHPVSSGSTSLITKRLENTLKMPHVISVLVTVIWVWTLLSLGFRN